MHERIREHSMRAGENVKVLGKENNLTELIAGDPMFMLQRNDLENAMKPELYIGRSSKQVEEFMHDVISPILEKYQSELGLNSEIHV